MHMRTSNAPKLYADHFRDDIVSQQDIDASVSVQESTALFAAHQTGLYVDESFPAPEKPEKEKKKPGELKCQCGTPVKTAKVQKGPNEGKEYFHCNGRRCRFFQWAVRFDHKSVVWQRFQPPTYAFVCDFGYQAEDLQQGSVGDCWFLSALSCVAERPDLIMRLLPTHVANTQGIYRVCLFLDGVWRGFCVDDRLPTTRGGLCYSQANNMQLWVPILEKAYAKAHGSYSAISGGEIAEAFTDLTGCPTRTYNFDQPNFSPRHFWSELAEYHRHRVPMGCATTSVRGLREVGLVPNHAYSILDIREFPNKHSGEKNLSGFHDNTLRLVRIRNPHGRGEWTGAWNDGDVNWRNLDLGLTTNENDGTFWMAYEDFLMGFQIVDVSLAYEHLHARSYQCEFPPKLEAERSCSRSFRVTAMQDTTLYVMVCQPTKRGAWCRDDVKTSYKPADIGIVAQYANGTVSGKMFGVQRTAHFPVTLKANDSVSLTPVALGFPLASNGGTFVVRLVSSQPVKVEKEAAVTGIKFARLMQDFCFSSTQKAIIHQSNGGKIGVFRDGSTIFVMAFAREPIGVQLTVKARGIGCRDAHGLVAHTTPDGPRIKYRSVWRHFSVNTMARPGSQIVATLFQSAGVDWEFGSIEGWFCPVENPVDPKGIFLPDSKEEWEVTDFGVGMMSAGIHLVPQDDDDEGDLDAALVLSLEDREFDTAVEMAIQMSRNGSCTLKLPAVIQVDDTQASGTEDQALLAALEESRKVEEEKLNAVLKRSREDAQSSVLNSCDLAAALAVSRREFDQGRVIDIDGDCSTGLVDLTDDGVVLDGGMPRPTSPLVLISEDEHTPKSKVARSF